MRVQGHCWRSRFSGGSCLSSDPGTWRSGWVPLAEVAIVQPAVAIARRTLPQEQGVWVRFHSIESGFKRGEVMKLEHNVSISAIASEPISNDSKSLTTTTATARINGTRHTTFECPHSREGFGVYSTFSLSQIWIGASVVADNRSTGSLRIDG